MANEQDKKEEVIRPHHFTSACPIGGDDGTWGKHTQRRMRGMIDCDAFTDLVKFEGATAHLVHVHEEITLSDSVVRAHRQLLANALRRPFAIGPCTSEDPFERLSNDADGTTVRGQAIQRLVRELEFDVNATLSRCGVLVTRRENLPFVCSTSGLTLMSTANSRLHVPLVQRLHEDNMAFAGAMAHAGEAHPAVVSSSTLPLKNDHRVFLDTLPAPSVDAITTSPVGQCAVLLVWEPQGIGSSLPEVARQKACFLGQNDDKTQPPTYTDACTEYLVRSVFPRAMFELIATGLPQVYVIVCNHDATLWNGMLLARHEPTICFIHSLVLKFAQLYLTWAFSPGMLQLTSAPPEVATFAIETLIELGLSRKEAAIATQPLSTHATVVQTQAMTFDSLRADIAPAVTSPTTTQSTTVQTTSATIATVEKKDEKHERKVRDHGKGVVTANIRVDFLSANNDHSTANRTEHVTTRKNQHTEAAGASTGAGAGAGAGADSAVRTDVPDQHAVSIRRSNEGHEGHEVSQKDPAAKPNEEEEGDEQEGDEQEGDEQEGDEGEEGDEGDEGDGEEADEEIDWSNLDPDIIAQMNVTE
jgi:hypothetical protein